MALTFNEKEHRYFDGDIELPSVTTITRFCHHDSMSWRGQDPFYRERGALVHDLCCDYDFTGELPHGTGVDGYLVAYANFKRDWRIKDWLHVEMMLGSAKHGFAGTLDRLGIIDGNLSILDIKTSSKLNILALSAQLTGYRILLGQDVNLYGLQLKKDGKYMLKEIPFDEELFYCCKTLHEKGLKK